MMSRKNLVFIAQSLDGYIADRNGGLEWLSAVPNPDQQDLGYETFYQGIDALVMGRNTFETVCGFEMEWPYDKPVYVLSSTLDSVPEPFLEKAKVVRGPLSGVLDRIHRAGYSRIYVDGGVTVQQFLKEDLIDELTVTTIPVLLGGGTPLFGELPEKMEFELVESRVLLNAMVQTRYRRKR
jgi:dihydrofolate reductase